MKVNVLLFGSLADIAGKSKLEISGCKDTQSLTRKITEEFPKLRDCEFLISVNKKIVINNQQLGPGNEIAFLPPFAGG